MKKLAFLRQIHASQKSGSREISTSGGLDPARVASFVQFHNKLLNEEAEIAVSL